MIDFVECYAKMKLTLTQNKQSLISLFGTNNLPFGSMKRLFVKNLLGFATVLIERRIFEMKFQRN